MVKAGNCLFATTSRSIPGANPAYWHWVLGDKMARECRLLASI